MLKLLLLALLLLPTPPVLYQQATSNTACSSGDLADSQLVAGINADVIATDPIPLYANPSSSAELVARLPTGTLLYLTTGPECRDGNIWWQGRFNIESLPGTHNFGWVAEFSKGQRQLHPRIPTLNPTLPRTDVPITRDNVSRIVSTVDMGPIGSVVQFVWSPDSAYLAISNERAIWVYHADAPVPNTTPIRLPPTATGFWNNIGSVAFGANSQTIATVGSSDGDLYLWSINGAPQARLQAHLSDYAGVATIAPDLSRWATAHYDGSIRVWDALTGSLLQHFTGHTIVGALAFTPDDSTLISSGGFPYASIGKKDNSLWSWNVISGERRRIGSVILLPPGIGGLKSRLSMSANGDTAAAFVLVQIKKNATVLLHIGLIDTKTASVQRQIPLSDGATPDMSFNADGKLLAVNAITSVLFIEADTGIEVFRLPFEHVVQNIAFSPDGRRFVVAYEADNFDKNIIQFWGSSRP